MKRTISLDGGKYEFDLDTETGTLLVVRRNGVEWPAGYEGNRFSKSFGSLLVRVVALEDENAQLRAALDAVPPEGEVTVPSVD